MDSNKIDMFMIAMNDKFPQEKIMAMREQLARVDDSKFAAIQSINYKSPVMVLILSLFFGSLGVDRFMLEEPGLGVLKLLTCGGFGIWTIIDWFLVMGKTKEYNYLKFSQIAV
jgi:TM2 domain-containing membrane protein YozV